MKISNKIIILILISILLVILLIFILIYFKKVEAFIIFDVKNFFIKIFSDSIGNHKRFGEFSQTEKALIILFLIASAIVIILTLVGIVFLCKKILKNDIINQELIYSDNALQTINDEKTFKGIESSALNCLGIMNICEKDAKNRLINIIYYQDILRISENKTVESIRNIIKFKNFIRENLIIKIELKKIFSKSHFILNHPYDKSEILPECKKKFLRQYIEIISKYINEATDDKKTNICVLSMERNNKAEIDTNNEVIKEYYNQNHSTMKISSLVLNYKLTENSKITNQYVIFKKSENNYEVQVIDESFSKAALKTILKNATYFEEKFECQYCKTSEIKKNNRLFLFSRCCSNANAIAL